MYGDIYISFKSSQGFFVLLIWKQRQKESQKEWFLNRIWSGDLVNHRTLTQLISISCREDWK